MMASRSGRQASSSSCLIRENKGYLNLWGVGRGFGGDFTSLAGAKECLICMKRNPRCLLDMADRLLTTSRVAEVGGSKALCAGTYRPRAGSYGTTPASLKMTNWGFGQPPPHSCSRLAPLSHGLHTGSLAPQW